MKSSLKFPGNNLLGVINVFLFAMLSGFTAQAQNGIKDAMKLIEIGQPDKAIESLNKSISDQPLSINLYYYLGYAQIQAGKVDDATKSVDAGLAKNEKEAILYAGKGHIQLLRKDAVGAKINFDKALSLSKNKNVEVMQAIARAYLSDPKTIKDGIAILEKAKILKADNTETYFLLGDAYLNQKNGGSAVSSYEWAAHYEPNNGKGSYKAGIVYLRTRDFKVAEDNFKKSIAADPNFAPSYDELAELAYAASDGPNAVKYFEKYLQLTGSQDKDKGRYAFYVLMTKDFAKANSIFKELVSKPDVSLTTRRYYAAALFEEGKFPEARVAFEQYFAKADTAIVKPVDYTYYGRTLFELKEDSLGVESIKKSLKKEPKQPELLRTLADKQYARKKYADAAVLYKQIIDNTIASTVGKTAQPKDIYSLGRSYYFSKNFVAADTTFTKLAELQPTVVPVHLFLSRTKASIEEAEKKPGLAKPFYEKLIEVASQTPDKYKVELIEGYSYLASYFAITKDDMSSAKSYMNKILTIDPKNATAVNFFAEIKKSEQKK